MQINNIFKLVFNKNLGFWIEKITNDSFLQWKFYLAPVSFFSGIFSYFVLVSWSFYRCLWKTSFHATNAMESHSINTEEQHFHQNWPKKIKENTYSISTNCKIRDRGIFSILNLQPLKYLIIKLFQWFWKAILGSSGHLIKSSWQNLPRSVQAPFIFICLSIQSQR